MIVLQTMDVEIVVSRVIWVQLVSIMLSRTRDVSFLMVTMASFVFI